MTSRNDPLTSIFGDGEDQAETPPTPEATAQTRKRRTGKAGQTQAKRGDSPKSKTSRDVRAAEPWEWPSGVFLPKTHRYPIELLEALEQRIDSLKPIKLPLGLTVAAAVAMLLDLSDDELVAAVRRAHASRPDPLS